MRQAATSPTRSARDALRVLNGTGQTLAREARAWVTYAPNNQHTAGADLRRKNIVVPALPADFSSWDWEVRRGFLDHECCHLLFTDPQDWETACAAGPALQHAMNVLEDARINHLGCRRWPGMRDNLNSTWRDIVNTGRLTGPRDQFTARIDAVHYLLQGLDQPPVSMDTSIIPDEAWEWARTWCDIHKTPLLAGTSGTALALAQRLVTDLTQDLEDAQEGSDEGGEGGAGRPQRIWIKGEGGDQRGTPSDGPQPGDTVVDDEDTGEGDDTDEDTGEGDDTGDGEGGIDGTPRDGPGGSQTKLTLDDLLKDRKDAFGDWAQDQLDQLSEQPASAIVDPGAESPYRPKEALQIKPWTHDAVTGVRPARRGTNPRRKFNEMTDAVKRVRGLSERVRQAILVTGVRSWARDLDAGELDPNKVAQLAAGIPGSYFREVNRGPSNNVGVQVLVDGSGSMDGPRERLAAAAAAALADLLFKVGASALVSVFNDRAVWDTNSLPAQRYRVDSQKKLASIGAMGGTPLSMAMRACIPRLMQARVDRRMLLCVTDGQPNDVDDTKFCRDLAERMGIEVYGVGIQSDVRDLYLENRSVNVQNLDALPKAVLQLFGSRIRGKAA